ncbi:hypothetical protein a10_04750 [Streptomyces acidiscabies]|nr:hypothetical protein a10_04750 [Streptomyces acidiscabies]
MVADEADVERDGLLPLRGVEAGLPVLVEPGAAEGVDDGREGGHDLAPAGEAAQADALHAGVGAVELRGEVGDLGPGGVGGHREVVGGEDVLAVHQEGRLAVEGLPVELAVVAGEGLAHRGEDVLLVVRRVVREVGVHGVEPAVAGVDGDLVVGEGRDVVLAGLVGEVLADLVADVVLGEDGEVDLDAGRLGEVAGGEFLEFGHLGVVDHQDVDGVTAGTGAAGAGPAAGQEEEGDSGQRGPLAGDAHGTLPKG